MKSEEALVRAYLAGDGDAFGVLFACYHLELVRFFVERLDDEWLAADLTQQTFLRLHHGRAHFDPERPLAPWIFRIARNLYRDELKCRMRRPGNGGHTQPLDEDTCWSERSAGCDPEQQLLRREAMRYLQAALAALPERQREIVILRDFEGFTFPEIARRLDEGAEAVRSRAFRAHRTLRRALHRELFVRGGPAI